MSPASSDQGHDVDVLAFGPHPDDVELFCGGTIVRIAELGHRVAVVDLTRGERGSHGSPEERAREGLFLAFQYPVEIPGVSNTYFLRAALNAIRAHRGEEELDAVDFLKLVKEKVKLLHMEEDLLKRPVNEGFSGGEKKRNEIFQMAVLEPRLAVLDETDSGLDIDALRVVADGVNAMRSPERAFLVITHYQRLLNYIIPDRVHVLAKGRIVASGGPELALDLEREGYDKYLRAA